ncbi:hypothetical protein HDU96_007225 [Phlyctochytrium bullatum]|nr:hypothetical protein HDU96_007225 [Phlyctochytrium bullatum]
MPATPAWRTTLLHPAAATKDPTLVKDIDDLILAHPTTSDLLSRFHECVSLVLESRNPIPISASGTGVSVSGPSAIGPATPSSALSSLPPDALKPLITLHDLSFFNPRKKLDLLLCKGCAVLLPPGTSASTGTDWIANAAVAALILPPPPASASRSAKGKRARVVCLPTPEKAKPHFSFGMVAGGLAEWHLEAFARTGEGGSASAAGGGGQQGKKTKPGSASNSQPASLRHGGFGPPAGAVDALGFGLDELGSILKVTDHTAGTPQTMQVEKKVGKRAKVLEAFAKAWPEALVHNPNPKLFTLASTSTLASSKSKPAAPTAEGTYIGCHVGTRSTQLYPLGGALCVGPLKPFLVLPVEQVDRVEVIGLTSRQFGIALWRRTAAEADAEVDEDDMAPLIVLEMLDRSVYEQLFGYLQASGVHFGPRDEAKKRAMEEAVAKRKALESRLTAVAEEEDETGAAMGQHSEARDGGKGGDDEESGNDEAKNTMDDDDDDEDYEDEESDSDAELLEEYDSDHQTEDGEDDDAKTTSSASDADDAKPAKLKRPKSAAPASAPQPKRQRSARLANAPVDFQSLPDAPEPKPKPPADPEPAPTQPPPRKKLQVPPTFSKAAAGSTLADAARKYHAKKAAEASTETRRGTLDAWVVAKPASAKKEEEPDAEDGDGEDEEDEEEEEDELDDG